MKKKPNALAVDNKMCAYRVPGDEDYKRALQALRDGGIVAYPTETFYGLAVDPLNAKAVASLYALKQRESTKAISLLVPDLKALDTCISELSDASKCLITAFWPGPLTLVCNASTKIFQQLTGDDNTLAVRISSHPVASTICRLWGGAITASSANISGEPALTNAASVRALWGNKLSCILDGGMTPGGKASTIIRCKGIKCRILREGVLSCQEIRDALPGYYCICHE